MRKLCTIITGIFLTLLFTNCQPFKDNIEDYLSYWSAEVIATDYRINPSYSTNAAGALCVPSIADDGTDTDVTVTVKLRNPKNFTLKMPSSPADAGKVIRFPRLSPQPEYGDTKDYTLTQTAPDTLTLTYKSGFLKKYEWGTGDISPEITFLTANNDRVFRQKFHLNLKADTAPALEYKGVGKTLVGSEWYYVLIFQAKGMNAKIGTEYVHRDIEKLHITKEGGASAVYTIQNINFSSQTFSWSPGDPLLNTATQLGLGDYEGSAPPFPETTDKWLIYYKTDIEVSASSAAKTYTAQLSDAAGLRSNEVECSTVKRKVGLIDLEVTNPSPYIPQSGENGAETQPYRIRCDENGATLKATCNTPGVTISYTVYDIISSSTAVETSKNSGASPLTGIRLIASGTVGHTKQYKVVLKATAPGFTEDTRDVYYTLTRVGDVTIDASTLDENEKWKKLRETVANATAGDIIIINGEIKATNDTGNYGEITIGKDLTIRGKSGKDTDILNADTAATGKTHRIFNVQSGKTLTLSGLTLKNATTPSDATGDGGAILVNISNGKVVLSNCTIKDCKAGTNNRNGGGIFVRSSGRAELSNCTIERCNAKQGGAIGSEGGTVTITGCTLTGNSATDGGAVYVTSSGVFTMHSGTISGNTVQSALTKTSGGGVYVAYGAMFTMKGGTISGNTATTQGSTGTKARGGGVCVSGDGRPTQFIMEGDSSKIIGNKVKTAGGGSYLSTIGGGVCVCDDATFEMKAGSIENNEALDGNVQYFGHAGGGVCVGGHGSASISTYTDDSASFTMTGGTISKNKAGYGGGVAVISNSSFTMKGGTIGGADDGDKNTATTDSGGGVAVMHGTFTMEGGMISKNTATGYGGGIHSMNFNGNKGVITVKGKSVISNNTASSGGGGIASSYQLTIQSIDSNSPVIKENITGSYGGGIYLPLNSTLTFTGGTVTNNTASRQGSGMYLQDARTTVNMSGSATVAANNDVYLGGIRSGHGEDGYAFITVIGALTGQQAATLTMQNDNAGYNEGREVVKRGSSYTFMQGDINKFPITQQTEPSEQKWTTELGTNALKLKKKTS
ncbi:right-handed parallel beta-helix repeat-containing protein [Treponema sp. OMZ 857]|uniref:right-handed parallel beta-helix repeat-containing protein n=1 Tax=Treponema sp. OMZ 857 TaxID=1643513 RepID=UPI0020A44315|nr:right-handed parallel beta-helix repeat-containing protein [Treponema sp. OMZ 857]UTC43536.1 right-handed parallel beta-helix repeat-containing protein [Treponema sp. OMZ 857]